MRVDVYRNLHNKLMSVKETNKRVITHADAVFLNDALFVVSEKGRQRVLRERCKNVHAVVRGELRGFEVGTNTGFDDWEQWPQVTYNPYKYETFVDTVSGDAVYSAPHVVVTTKGVFYVPTVEG